MLDSAARRVEMIDLHRTKQDKDGVYDVWVLFQGPMVTGECCTNRCSTARPNRTSLNCYAMK
jgi:hypothetical protein